MEQLKLEIFTLGRFVVRKADQIISDHKSTSVKLWEVFQYLLSHYQEIVAPEKIIDDLEFDMELIDAKNALENRIYRLRKIISTGEKYQANKYIQYKHGGYTLNTEEGCWCDLLDFLNGCNKGKQLLEEGKKDRALDIYIKALKLYQGDYLNCRTNTSWVVAPRVKYKQIYLDSLYVTCSLLKKIKEYKMIEDFCLSAVQIEPFEERLHYLLVESLYRQGYQIRAKKHYQFVRDLFAQQGVEPYLDFEKFFTKELPGNKGIVDLDKIKLDLKIQLDLKSLSFVEPEVYREFVQHQQKAQKRSGEQLFMASVAIQLSSDQIAEEIKNKYYNDLKESLRYNLRDSDIVCEWSQQQFLMLLSGMGEVQVRQILERIKDAYYQSGEQQGSFLNTAYQLL